MATAIDPQADNYGCAYLDSAHDMSQGDYYYNMAFYYALGKGTPGREDEFAAAFVRHVRRQVLDGNYDWSVVDYYLEWKDNNS